MSWLTNVQLAQQLKQQQAQRAAPAAPAPQPPSPISSGITAMPPEPGSTRDIVRQVQTPSGESHVYVRSDYNVRVVDQFASPQGVVTTYEVTPKVVPQTQPQVVAPIVGKNLPGAVPDVFGNPLKGQVLLQTPESRTIALGTIVSVVAPAVVPEILPAVSAGAVVKGELLGVGINQGFKLLQGGGLLTPSEFVTGAAQDALLTTASGAVVRGASAAGKALGIGLPSGAFAREASQRLGMVAINTGVAAGAGAGLELAQTGRVTRENVALNAAYGAAFGAAGELTGLGGPKVLARTGITPKAQRMVNLEYQTAVESNVMYRPSLKAKVASTVLNVKPSKPAASIVELPTIPTAPKEAFETVRELRPEALLAERGKAYRDTFSGIAEQPKIAEPFKDVLVEKTTPESIRLIPRMQAGLTIADYAETSVMYGKSVPPEVYYAEPRAPTAKQLPVFEMKGGELVEQKPILSFKKTAVETRVENLRVRDNTLRDLVSNADLFPKISPTDMPTSEASAIRKAQYKPATLNTKQVEAELNKAWIIEEPKGTAQSAVAQELVSGVKGEPTGAAKIVSDIQSGRAIETARLEPTLRAGASPFAYRGRSYYPQRQREEEELETVISYPAESGLRQPSILAERTRRGASAGFVPMVSSTPMFNTSPFVSGLARTTVRQRSFASPLLNLRMGFSAVTNQPVRFDVAESVGLQPIQKPTQEPIMTTPIISPITTPMPEIVTPKAFINVPTKISAGLDLPTFKFERGGLDLPSRPRRVGIRSKKQTTPILTGREVLKL